VSGKRLLAILLLLLPAACFGQGPYSYNFINTGTNGPGVSFANTGITAFSLSWAPQLTVFTCSVQVDSSSDGVSWGNGDLIASQNCATVGSAAAATLASGKTWVRVHVTALTGNGSVNVTLTGGNGSGGGISSVSSLPATCTPGTSQPVQLTVAIVVNTLTYGPSTVFYCDSTNHYSPVSQGSGAGPNLAYYLSPQCPPSNTANCVNTPADALLNNACSWNSGNTTLHCFTSAIVNSASVTSNVATYNMAALPAGWASGDTITIYGFNAANFDNYFNQTCTSTAATSTSISCALTHANGTSAKGDYAVIVDQNVGPFTANDVGKSLMGFATCATDQAAAAYDAGFVSLTALVTINAFTNNSTVTISANPGVTQNFTAGTYPQGGCVVYGHLDDAGFAAMDTLLINAPACPKLFIGGSNYFIQNPHFFTQPVACAITGPDTGLFFGNIILSAGFEVDGRGTSPTTIYIAPSFPNGDPCNHVATPASNSTGACWAIPLLGKWSDFRISGGGNPRAGNMASTANFLTAEVGTMQNITMDNFGAMAGFTGASNGTQMTCLDLGFEVYLYHYNNSGCGSTAIHIRDNTGLSQGYRVVVENSWFKNLVVGQANNFTAYQPNFTCNWCEFFGSSAAAFGAPIIVDNSGILYLENTKIADSAITSNGALTNLTLYQGTVAGATLYMHQGRFEFNRTGVATNSTVIKCTAACTNYFDQNTLASVSTGFTNFTDIAGSKFFDLGGNTGFIPATVNGAWIGEANSSNGTIVTAGKLVLSANWGTSAAVGTLSGGNAPIQFTITNGTAATGASPTIAYTFPTVYAVAPYSCTATQTGGTNAVGTFTSSALSATGVTFTFSLTPTANSTEIVNVTCITP
jgi:hypothetical protein